MSAAWEIVPSLTSHRDGSIRSIEIEVFQKISNSLNFDANSGARYAVDFRNFSNVISLIGVHGDNFQIFVFQIFQRSQQPLILDFADPCKVALGFAVGIRYRDCSLILLKISCFPCVNVIFAITDEAALP